MTPSCSPSRRSHGRVHTPHHWRGADERERSGGGTEGQSICEALHDQFLKFRPVGLRLRGQLSRELFEAVLLILLPMEATPFGRPPRFLNRHLFLSQAASLTCSYSSYPHGRDVTFFL